MKTKKTRENIQLNNQAKLQHTSLRQNNQNAKMVQYIPSVLSKPNKTLCIYSITSILRQVYISDVLVQCHTSEFLQSDHK